jgi:hypothetical protein
MKVQSTRVMALATAALLTACGGGGGSNSPATPTSITIAGTAARGAALAGATVSAKCAEGTTTVPTTTADNGGVYTLTINGANLPCVLKAAGTEGSTFHSLVGGTGSTGSFVANITPLTEMVVAHAAGASPASFYANFGSSSSVPLAKLDAGVAYVQAALAPVTDLAGLNPMTGALVVGNPLDQKIDAAVAGLAAAGLSLAQAIDAILANPAAPDVVARPLQVPAASCASLKSGKYRMINPYETDVAWKYHVLTVNAVALTATTFEGEVIPLTGNGECKFTIDSVDETNTVLVSPGGVLVVYGQSKLNAASRWVTVGIPEQTLPVSELAGTWNMIDWDPNSGGAVSGYVGSTDQTTLDATGQITALSRCLGLAACDNAAGPFPRVATAATGGGFDLIEDGANIGRVFLYKGFNGKLVFVAVTDDGEFIIGSRQEPLGALPAVGQVTNYREFGLNGDGTLTNLLDQSNTVTAVDATAKTVTRLRTTDNRIDTLAYDTPRDGLRHRAQGSCTNSVTGAVINCAQVVHLPLQGMGITLSMSVSTVPTAGAFFVSISKP